MPARLRLTVVVVVFLAVGALGAVLVAARSGTGAAEPEAFAGALRPPGIAPSDFSLSDQDGRPASLGAYRGQVVVLTFLYSHCRDTCPVTTQQVRGALDDLGHQVPTLAVSVDPAHDTPNSARAFLVEQHMSGRMRFLLGSPRQLAPIWQTYGVQGQGPGRGPRSDHSAYVILLDRQGRQRIGFPAQELTPEGLAHDIRRLAAERSSA